jgi:hypothetical protein
MPPQSPAYLSISGICLEISLFFPVNTAKGNAKSNSEKTNTLSNFSKVLSGKLLAHEYFLPTNLTSFNSKSQLWN